MTLLTRRPPRIPKSKEASFASHPRAAQWSFALNAPWTPLMVFPASNIKRWFVCDRSDCGHTFQCTPHNITKRGWCPFCVNKLLCKINNCTSCRAKTLAMNARVVECWHPTKNEGFTPRDVFRCSCKKKVTLKCDICPHDFEALPCNLTYSGNWCPYCASGHNKLCSDANCEWCFNRSFASYTKACTSITWDKDANGSLTPRDVSRGSDRKAYFECTTCPQKFRIAVVSASQGTGCGLCKQKTAKKLFVQLGQVYPALKTPFAVDWCKNIMRLPFDFALVEDRIIIELDGDQHFKQVWNWLPPEEIHDRDIFKQKCANDNGYSMIRVLQTDVKRDRNDWLNKVLAAIVRLKKLRGTGVVDNEYISSGNEYVIFENN